MQYTHKMAEIVQFFGSNFRTDADIQTGEPRWVGLENEYLMVSRDGTIIRPVVLEYLWQGLSDQGWKLLTDHITGKTKAAIKLRPSLSINKAHNYDVITTDFGYSTLEIALAPAQSIKEGQNFLCGLIQVVTSILSKYDTHLLGYGVQPITAPSRAYIGPNHRYELVFNTREDENALNPEALSLDLHCINAACQTQVEISVAESIPIVNALNATSGLRIALVANSSVWRNEVSNYKANRQLFWDWGWPNRKLQVGIPPRFQSIEHYVDYIFDFRSILAKRGQTLYRLNNNIAFRQFVNDENGQIGVSFNNEELRIFGDVEDVNFQSGFAWFDARLQPGFGTVEDRVSCQQPPHAHFGATALTLGLVENYRDLVEIANLFSLDQWRDIRLLACTCGLSFSYPGVNIKNLIERMLQIAHQGLNRRGFGEEAFLGPLFERLDTGRCPADDARLHFLEGGVAKIVSSNDMRNLLRPSCDHINE